SVSVSVAVLLVGLGSVGPPCAATMTWLTSVPVAFGSIVPVSMTVAVAPGVRFVRSNESVPGGESGERVNPGKEEEKTWFNRGSGIVSVRVGWLPVSGRLFVTVFV